MFESLKLRMTHKYVGTYKYLDEWREVGTFEIANAERWKLEQEDKFDPTEPLKHIYYIQVYHTDDATVEDVAKALQDSLTQVGCHHEYDCCGCRSFYANKPVRLSDGEWKVEVNSYRNY